LVVAIGLVCVVEGLLWALAPRTTLKMLEALAHQPEFSLRVVGTLLVTVGVALVWLVRGGQ
jgi:uncharacterized protein